MSKQLLHSPHSKRHRTHCSLATATIKRHRVLITPKSLPHSHSSDYQIDWQLTVVCQPKLTVTTRTWRTATGRTSPN